MDRCSSTRLALSLIVAGPTTPRVQSSIVVVSFFPVDSPSAVVSSFSPNHAYWICRPSSDSTTASIHRPLLRAFVAKDKQELDKLTYVASLLSSCICWLIQVD